MTARTIELELEHARNLARGAKHFDVIPGLAGSLKALTDAIDHAERVPDVMEALRQGLTDIKDAWDEGVAKIRERVAAPPAAPAGHPPRPEWSNVAKATRIIGQVVKDDPAYVARADALGAYVRDTWDALGLSLYDEDTLYTSLVMASLFVEMANNGRGEGMVDDTTVEVIAKIAQSFTASILDYLPPEATR